MPVVDVLGRCVILPVTCIVSCQTGNAQFAKKHELNGACQTEGKYMCSGSDNLSKNKVFLNIKACKLKSKPKIQNTER